MLDHYFKFTYPAVLRRMRRGPLGGEIDAIASALTRTGYTRCESYRVGRRAHSERVFMTCGHPVA
jgi:hypothetical protein